MGSWRKCIVHAHLCSHIQWWGDIMYEVNLRQQETPITTPTRGVMLKLNPWQPICEGVKLTHMYSIKTCHQQLSVTSHSVTHAWHGHVGSAQIALLWLYYAHVHAHTGVRALWVSTVPFRGVLLVCCALLWVNVWKWLSWVLTESTRLGTCYSAEKLDITHSSASFVRFFSFFLA